MAKKDDSTLRYRVTIKGHYFMPAEQGTKQLPYEVTVPMDAEMIKAGPLSIFKRYIAPVVMPEKYPGFTCLATHEIVSSIASDPDKKVGLELMNREQMIAYIEEESLPVVEDVYVDTDSLKQAIIDCEENPTVFEENQKKFMDKHATKIRMKRKAQAILKEETDPPATNDKPAQPEGVGVEFDGDPAPPAKPEKKRKTTVDALGNM